MRTTGGTVYKLLAQSVVSYAAKGEVLLLKYFQL